MADFQDDIPRYRKKAKKRVPVKAKHKHEYVNCVYDIPWRKYDPTHGCVTAYRRTIGTICPICGKVGTTADDGWRVHARRAYGYEVEWSTEAIREFDDSTRTLPFFRLKNMFQSYVNNDDEEEDES